MLHTGLLTLLLASLAAGTYAGAAEALNPQPVHSDAGQPMNLAAKAPAGKHFAGLAAAIEFYETLDRAGQWQPLPDGPLLRLGDLHPQVPLLRRQLLLLGDLAPEDAQVERPERFDPALHQALLRFQDRHGAKVDGILGPQTRSMLNVPPRERIDQLLVNRVRQRALAAVAGSRYIQVNIPEYRLRLYEQGEVLLEMKTIIGRKKRQTPVFSSTIQTLVINPSWNVPKSIAFKDILPLWEKDRSYLAQRNLQVLSGWSDPRVVVPDDQVDPAKMYSGAEYLRLWEPPGAGNTLGRIKFQSYSRYAIYLHDTPARHLFSLPSRAFSSGCIRVEKARELADTLLRLASPAQPTALDPLLETEETHKIRLAQPVPFHVTYWTAWLDEQGVLNFREDLYRRDRLELAELKDGSSSVVANRRFN